VLMAWALSIFVTWVVLAAVLVGIGSIVLAILSRDYVLTDALWIGLGVSTAVLQIWNLLLPVNSKVVVVLLGVGAFGLVFHRSSLASLLSKGLKEQRWVILFGVAIVLLIAVRACGPCDHYDTGLYGAPAVRWATTYPTVPGLANVHGRLGFNSSVFLWVAALDQGGWKNQADHLFTGFVLVAIWLTILPAVARVVGKSSMAPSDWFYCILAIPMFYWATRAGLVGTLTDQPATIACLAGAGMLFDGFALKNGEEKRQASDSRLVVAAALFTLAVTFKQSTILFAVVAWCLVLWRIWKTEQTTWQRAKYVGAVLSLTALVLLPWFVRGIILSGYPFYPATVLGFPFDWKTPAGAANWNAALVRSWGRNLDAHYFADTQGFGWLRGWVTQSIRDRASFQVPIAISLAGVVAGGLGRAKARVHASPWLWLLAPSLAGLIFWFWASPSLRFAQFAIWTMAATLGTWGIVSLRFEPQQVRAGAVLAGLLALLLWCLAGFGWKEPYQALLAVRNLPGLPRASFMERRTLSGLAVNVPVDDDRCWDAPLPCTPYFDETLRLRDGRDMRRGFAVEERPEYWRRHLLDPIR